MQQEFVFIASDRLLGLRILEHSGLRSESCTLPEEYSGARVNEHQERGSGSSVGEYQGHLRTWAVML